MIAKGIPADAPDAEDRRNASSILATRMQNLLQQSEQAIGEAEGRAAAVENEVNALCLCLKKAAQAVTTEHMNETLAGLALQLQRQRAALGGRTVADAHLAQMARLEHLAADTAQTTAQAVSQSVQSQEVHNALVGIGKEAHSSFRRAVHDNISGVHSDVTSVKSDVRSMQTALAQIQSQMAALAASTSKTVTNPLLTTSILTSPPAAPAGGQTAADGKDKDKAQAQAEAKAQRAAIKAQKAALYDTFVGRELGGGMRLGKKLVKHKPIFALEGCEGCVTRLVKMLPSGPKADNEARLHRHAAKLMPQCVPSVHGYIVQGEHSFLIIDKIQGCTFADYWTDEHGVDWAWLANPGRNKGESNSDASHRQTYAKAVQDITKRLNAIGLRYPDRTAYNFMIRSPERGDGRDVVVIDFGHASAWREEDMGKGEDDKWEPVPDKKRDALEWNPDFA